MASSCWVSITFGSSARKGLVLFLLARLGAQDVLQAFGNQPSSSAACASLMGLKVKQLPGDSARRRVSSQQV